MPFIGAIIGGGLGLLGSSMQSSAANKATAAQRDADMARLAEEQRVREQLRADTEKQRKVADDAFAQYKAGLISYADAQRIAGQAMQGVQQTIAQSQLSDVGKATAMAEFKPYAVTTGAGRSFYDTATGQAGFQLAPEQQAYQQGLMGKATQAMGGIAASPQEAAQQYMQQQLGLLAPSREAEDAALRQQQLQTGRIGLGIASGAAGAGGGGLVNPEQFAKERARAQADAAIAAQATQAGQEQAAKQLALTTGLFGAGMAPETFGLDVMKTGFNLGQGAAQAGAAQAGLYGAGMTDYYKSLLGAAQTGQQANLFTPQAQQTGAQEAYQRQQTYLQGLQGSNLPYQAMTTPSPMIPGSAYAGAALGGSLASMGSGLFSNYLKQQMQPSPYTMSWENAQNARVASAYPMP